jgi:hypothetical protein
MGLSARTLVEACGIGVGDLSLRHNVLQGTDALALRARLEHLAGQKCGIYAHWLSEHPNIAGQVKWKSHGIPVQTYFEWPASRKLQLQKAIGDASAALAAWKPGAKVEDDPLPENLLMLNDADGPRTVVTTDAAWKSFLSQVGHSLALEISQALPWFLSELPPTHMAQILDGRRQFRQFPKNGVDIVQYPGITGYELGQAVSWGPPSPNAAPPQSVPFEDNGNPGYHDWMVPAPGVIPASPLYKWCFLHGGVNPAASILANDALGTIVKMLTWCRKNLAHFTGNSDAVGTLNTWGFRGGFPTSFILSETDPPSPPPAHETAGCHGTVDLLWDVLRAANIPVARIYHAQQHTGAFFPGAPPCYLGDGDNPYRNLSTSLRHFAARV